jgi:hypothetical protein
MNEIELIRGQLLAERQHASAVAQACLLAVEREHGSDAATGEFRAACVDYLVRVLAAFEERDQRLADLMHAQRTFDVAVREALERALALPGRGREALQRLEVASAKPAGPPAQDAWKRFVQYFNGPWCARREALDAQLATNHRVTDWRALSAIDADSVLEERRGYARVCGLVPAGVILPPAMARAE